MLFSIAFDRKYAVWIWRIIYLAAVLGLRSLTVR